MSEKNVAEVTTSRPGEKPVFMHKSAYFAGQDYSAVTTAELYQDIEAQAVGGTVTLDTQQENSSSNSAVARHVHHQATSSTSTSSTVPFEKEDDLPRKKHIKAFRALRWMWLTIYHRLCLLVLLPNVIIVVTLAAQHNWSKIPLPHMATAVAANTAVAILVRQESVINLLFILVASCPRRAPLRIRRLLAKIYHMGGVHSGAGIAATIWFTLFNATLLWKWQMKAIPGLPRDQIPPVVAITIVIDLLLLLIVAFAHPDLRRRFHNTFEAVHRFAGWLAVLLFWIHLFLLTDLLEKSTQSQRPLGAVLVRSPALYLLIVITISLIIPWLRLRRVPLRTELLSNHASRWHFDYTNVELCSASRVTDRPLKEWHSFAGIPEPDGKGFSVIVSNAGDWTKRMIQNPPKKLWIRGIPTHGVLRIATIFNKLVLVATGSGIGPILSLISARDTHCRILWSARDPIHTYGKAIMDEIFIADPAAVVLDTKILNKDRRPDLLRLAYGLYQESSAEAVFVISNQKVTEKLVYGLESRGVPTFAPIFDS